MHARARVAVDQRLAQSTQTDPVAAREGVDAATMTTLMSNASTTTSVELPGLTLLMASASQLESESRTSSAGPECYHKRAMVPRPLATVVEVAPRDADLLRYVSCTLEGGAAEDEYRRLLTTGGSSEYLEYVSLLATGMPWSVGQYARREDGVRSRFFGSCAPPLAPVGTVLTVFSDEPVISRGHAVNRIVCGIDFGDHPSWEAVTWNRYSAGNWDALLKGRLKAGDWVMEKIGQHNIHLTSVGAGTQRVRCEGVFFSKHAVLTPLRIFRVFGERWVVARVKQFDERVLANLFAPNVAPTKRDLGQMIREVRHADGSVNAQLQWHVVQSTVPLDMVPYVQMARNCDTSPLSSTDPVRLVEQLQEATQAAASVWGVNRSVVHC